MANEKVLNVTTDNFDEEVMNSEQPVLVDFWAPWCGPCRMVGPVVEELAEQYFGRVKVGKLNVDEQQELAGRYKVMSIPTIMLFKDGDVVEKVVGARTREEFEKMIDKFI